MSPAFPRGFFPPSLSLALLGAGLLLPAPTTAQVGSGTVYGEVMSVDDDPIGQAVVEARYVPTGTVARTTSGPDGGYQLVNLRSGGPYEITVEAPGYAEVRRTGIELASEQRLELDFVLSAQPFELEGLEIAVDRRFEISRTGPSVAIRREEIATHPTIERNFMELAALSPMAVQTSDEGGFSISGQGERANTVLVDGNLNQDLFGASASGVPGAAARAKPIPLEAVGEFRVNVAPFDARSSGFTGGALDAATRSGTNEWTGTAFSQFRNEEFFGSLRVDGEDVAPADYRRYLWGFSVGGPIQRDRAHIFAAAEFENRDEPPPGFSHGVNDPLRTRIHADSMARMSEVLHDLGVDPGTAGPVSLDNPLSNAFVRADWTVSDRHTLVLSHNYARAVRDSTPNRATFGPYEYSSAGHERGSRTHTTRARLTSRFDGGHTNELTANLQRSSDWVDPVSQAPQVDVRMWSDFDGRGLIRDARAGSRYATHRDAADQSLLQVSNHLSLARDEIVTILGADLEYFRFNHDYLPGAQGAYEFGSLRELEENRPLAYEVHSLLPGVEDVPVRFRVLEPSIFAQQEHQVGDGLTLNYGLRIDVPLFPDRPDPNPEIAEEFDLHTDQLPSGHVLLSPRLGFNWQSEHRYRSQVRGGFGLFTGRFPFVWMANAHQDTGLRSAVLVCDGEYAENARRAPPLDPGASPPLECADGSGLEERGLRRVTAFDPDFRYPRELKISTSFDQLLPADFVLSGEGLVVLTFGRPVVENVNISSPRAPGDDGYSDLFGFRAQYGEPTGTGYEPERRLEDYAHVLRIDNDERAATAWAATVQIDRDLGEHVHLTGAYTRSRTKDRQSLVFRDMAMNLAATPIGSNAQEFLSRRANFDRPHKVVVNARTSLPRRWGGAELALFYVGQSGQPYSYVYGSDVNADGFPGPGARLDASNDLLFVPEEPASVSGSLVSRHLFARFVNEVEDCLAGVRGEIMDRNSCRAPSTHRLDFRASQPISLGRFSLEVTAEVLNVLNLVNSSWGRIWEVDPVVPLLDVVGREDTDMLGNPIPTSRAVLGYAGGLAVDDEGELRPTLPHNLIVPSSQWQAQVGLRLSF